jgi:2-methylcitrate dehydratase PrpD
LGITRDICEIIHATTYESLGEECIQRVKQAIKDGVAVALAGSKEEPVTILTEHLLSLGGLPQASIWGSGHKVSVVQAAYVNSVATHVQDFEPMWSPPTHAVSPTVPVAFALAEMHSLNGKQLITAVAKGLEIQGRLQYAGDQYVPEELKFHPPGYAGVIGSAVVASELLQLDVPKMRNAIGLAASRAGGSPPTLRCWKRTRASSKRSIPNILMNNACSPGANLTASSIPASQSNCSRRNTAPITASLPALNCIANSVAAKTSAACAWCHRS